MLPPLLLLAETSDGGKATKLGITTPDGVQKTVPDVVVVAVPFSKAISSPLLLPKRGPRGENKTLRTITANQI
jgi:hypothetical protein